MLTKNLSLTSGGTAASGYTSASPQILGQAPNEIVSVLLLSTAADKVSEDNPDLVGVARGRMSLTERRSATKAGVVHHNLRNVITLPQVSVKQGVSGLVASNTLRTCTVNISLSCPSNISNDPDLLALVQAHVANVAMAYSNALKNQDSLADVLTGL